MAIDLAHRKGFEADVQQTEQSLWANTRHAILRYAARLHEARGVRFSYGLSGLMDATFVSRRTNSAPETSRPYASVREAVTYVAFQLADSGTLEKWTSRHFHRVHPPPLPLRIFGSEENGSCRRS
jgi:hypothetical protein